MRVRSAEVVGLARSLPRLAAVAHEAGPKGFASARSFTWRESRAWVAAPSKVQRPTGGQVKTDARDALYLARLLRLDVPHLGVGESAQFFTGRAGSFITATNTPNRTSAMPENQS